MSRGSLIGPALLLAGLLTLTNGVSCYHTLTTIDHKISIEEDRLKRERDHWFNGFPVAQMRNIVEGYGQRLAYFIDPKVREIYRSD